MTQLNKAHRLVIVLRLQASFLLVSMPCFLDKARIYIEANPFL